VASRLIERKRSIRTGAAVQGNARTITEGSFTKNKQASGASSRHRTIVSLMRSIALPRLMSSATANQHRVWRSEVLLRSKRSAAGYDVFSDSVQAIKLLIAEGDLVVAWTTDEGTSRDHILGPAVGVLNLLCLT
jgi:hypothetical protein